LNQDLQECGCSLGATFMGVGFLGSVLWQSLFSAWNILHWPGFLLRALLTVIMAAGGGKFLGLALAETRLRRVEEHIRSFERNLAQGADHVELHEMGK
jgi:hypothetical protein